MYTLSAEQRALQQRAADLAEQLAPRAADTDRSEAYPWYAVEALRDAGFMGMTIPPAYGGGGHSYFDTVLVIEQLAAACGASARIAVESNMGAIGAVMQYGSDAQKRLAAGLVLAGDKPAICITEPDAGSAAGDMCTRAIRDGDHYVIDGEKHWITGGGVSKLHLIFARVIEHNVEQGIGGFLVVRDPDNDTNPAGFTVAAREPAMGIRGIPEARLEFQQLRVHQDLLVKPPGGLRAGFKQLMTAYNAQRVGAATVALGIANGAHRLALAYSQQREQFGRPICEFQGLQWQLADMEIQLAAAQALVYKAALSDNNGFPDMHLAAQAKIFAAEAAIKVTNDALQIHGAAGYSRNQPLERMLRDARMFTISGGTAQVLRNQVAAQLLGRKLPQTRDGYQRAASPTTELGANNNAAPTPLAGAV